MKIFFKCFLLSKNKSGAKGKIDSLYCVQNGFELEEFCPKNACLHIVRGSQTMQSTSCEENVGFFLVLSFSHMV